jgi:squalene-associated FAD-dependent desaturase
LRLLDVVGIDTAAAFLRLPLQMCYPPGSGGMDFRAPRLPAPLHMVAALFRADGLQVEDKMALARFSTTARWMEWRLNSDCTVTALLERWDQTARIIQLLWRPLCIAALNTPPERASAQVFLQVLRDSLGARRAASDMLLPRVDLSALFPDQAAAYLRRNRGVVLDGLTVQSITRAGSGWCIASEAGHESHFDAVVVATQAKQAWRLLDGLDLITEPQFEYEPITTCYLQYAPTLRLARAFFALLDNPAPGHWGQFVFDRGQLDAAQGGLLAVVVSTSLPALELGHNALATALAQQLASALRMPQLAEPVWRQVISEKRATFACTPALARPANATASTNLVLAGDYTASDYPATLESAVRSGVEAARLLLS